MKSIATVIITNLQRYLARSICGLFVMLAIWQGIAIGVDTALAASIEEVVVPEGIGNNRANIVKQLEEKEKLAEQKAESALKDPAESLLDIAKTGVKIDADKAEKSSSDTPEIVKTTADRNSKQAEKFSEKTTKKVKGLLNF